MRPDGADERWVQANSDNGAKEVEDEEEEEALSLCDLPIIESQKRSRKEVAEAFESQEDFNFCSGGDFSCKESEMCAADDIFFQGQILPLRHSVSYDGGFVKLQSDSRNESRCMAKSESMDHSCSVGLTSVSSRSSSINSHRSSSSGSSSASTTTNTTATNKHKPRPRVGIQFEYSHPSPRRQIRPSNISNKNALLGNYNRKSALWSLLRVGLVTTPEIAIQDLKNRTNSNKISAESFGGRNSTASFASGNSNNTIYYKTIAEKKKKQFFEKTRFLFSNCKCSADAIGTVPSRVAVIRRIAGENDADDEEKQHQHAMQKTKQQQTGKQALSRHRTFEWLKQLSLEAAMDES